MEQEIIDSLTRRITKLEDDCNCSECDDQTTTSGEIQYARVTLDVRDQLGGFVNGLIWNIDVEEDTDNYERQFQTASTISGSIPSLPTVLLPIGVKYSIYLDTSSLLQNGRIVVSLNDALNETEVTGDVTVIAVVSGIET